MAKEWAKRFYNSKAWLICRDAYIKKVFGLCERCAAPGKIVHHKVWLTPDNINDPAVTLNHDLLELVCQTCHNHEHHGIAEPIVEDGLMFDEHGDLVAAGRGERDENDEWLMYRHDGERETARAIGGRDWIMGVDYARRE